MLIEFTVGNCLSFDEPQTFSMVAAKLPGRKLEETHVVEVAGTRLLRSAALYGANASGKSNLMTALNFFIYMARFSATRLQQDDEIDVDAFALRRGNEKLPSYFEMVFLLDNRKYRYGFEVTRQRVVSEWLFRQTSSRETRLFTRENDDIDNNDKAFREGRDKKDKVRDNALFLPVIAQWNGATAKKILRAFRGIISISGLRDRGYASYTATCLYEKEHRNRAKILNFLQKLDLSYDDVDVQEVKAESESGETSAAFDDAGDKLPRKIPLSVSLNHPVFDDEGRRVGSKAMDLAQNASEGTRKLFGLAGPLVDALTNGYVLFVDEMDARLHPLVTRSIVQLFNSPESNPCNAQLIFNTHDTNLLTSQLLRRDQIWFAEKDRQQATHLYSLAEFRQENGEVARQGANFEDQYVQGRFGAVPFLGDFAALFADRQMPCEDEQKEKSLDG